MYVTYHTHSMLSTCHIINVLLPTRHCIHICAYISHITRYLSSIHHIVNIVLHLLCIYVIYHTLHAIYMPHSKYHTTTNTRLCSCLPHITHIHIYMTHSKYTNTIWDNIHTHVHMCHISYSLHVIHMPQSKYTMIHTMRLHSCTCTYVTYHTHVIYMLHRKPHTTPTQYETVSYMCMSVTYHMLHAIYSPHCKHHTTWLHSYICAYVTCHTYYMAPICHIVKNHTITNTRLHLYVCVLRSHITHSTCHLNATYYIPYCHK